MVELKIKEKDEGQRLNKYLMKYLKNAPSSFIYKMLRKKNIVLNDKKSSGNEIIQNGDSIKLYLSDETIGKFKNGEGSTVDSDLDNVKNKSEDKFGKNSAENKKEIPDLIVLYKNENILAVHKPAGILSQKSVEKDYSINEMIIDYCRYNNVLSKEDFETFKPSVCNRLDRNTSGIILAGISLKGSQYLSRVLKDRTADKYYFTIVKGVFKKHLTEKGYIHRNYPENKSKVISVEEYKALKSNKDDYVYVETEFIPVSNNNKYSLIKIKLITGKTHQIRAHLSALGYPIIGDTKYGDNIVNQYIRKQYKLKHHLLHAGYVNLDGVKIYDEIPDIFKTICIKEGIPYANLEF